MKILLVAAWYLLVLVASVCAPVSLRADGCVLVKGGKYVAEKEQRAFIEWENDHERLFVATRLGETSGPALWIIPVPAKPEQVKAEPVALFPHVVVTKPIIEPARDVLGALAGATLFLDTGIGCLMLPWALGESRSSTFSSVGSNIEVYQHVEKLGMVVEVLTARSTEALDRYLAEKKLDVRAAQVAALEPYLEKEFTLICGWPSDATKKLEARAVQIDFPSPVVFFPLQPTRLNGSPLETSIYVRGWVQPQAGSDIPGLRCKYVHGLIRKTELGSAFSGDLAIPKHKASQLNASGGDLVIPWYMESQLNTPLTRVDLSSAPEEWTEDLLLEPKAPLAIRVAQRIVDSGRFTWWFGSVLLGALLASFLPLVVIPKEKRSLNDWLCSTAVGAALGLSIWVSAILYVLWINSTKTATATIPPGKTTAKKLALTYVGLWVLSLLLSLFYQTASELQHDLGIRVTFSVVMTVLMALPIASFINLITLAPKKAAWLFAFAALHLVVVGGSCLALSAWLSRYS